MANVSADSAGSRIMEQQQRINKEFDRLSEMFEMLYIRISPVLNHEEMPTNPGGNDDQTSVASPMSDWLDQVYYRVQESNNRINELLYRLDL